MEKSIKVSLDTDQTLPIHMLEPLQGELKTLSEKNKIKLKNSILEHGFSYPIFVWESEEDNKIYILDGHQRRLVLLEFKEEGYSIPQIPVYFIPADNLNDAKSKLLAAASHFGEFNPEGVHAFIQDLDFNLDTVEIPFLEFASIIPEDETTTVKEHERKIPNNAEEEWTGMPEFEQPDKTSFRHVIVHFDSHEDAADFFEKIGQSGTEKTKSIWYPEKERMDTESKRYG